MNIQFRRSSDSNYAESLTQINMASYYLSREITWDSEQLLTCPERSSIRISCIKDIFRCLNDVA